MKISLKRLFWLSIAAVLTACGTDNPSETFARMQADYRFAAKPQGLDGPAAGCVVCHSVEKGGTLRVAPALWDIVGNPKARFSWYGYSQALAKAGGNWTEEDLDAYLEDPDTFLPGTTKTLIGIEDPSERADLISYLKTLRD